MKKAKAEQARTTYFLAKNSGLFRPGAETILANSSVTTKATKPQLRSMDDVRFPRGKSQHGGGQGGGALFNVDPPLAPTTPAWVPANAKVHIDFLGGSPQGRAWSNGAEVAVNTLVGNDPVADNNWDTTFAFNPSNLSPNGYLTPGMAFLGAARSKLLSGATVAYRFYETSPALPVNLMWLANGSAGFEIDAQINDTRAVGAFSNTGGFSLSTAADLVFNASGCVNGIAATFVSNRMDIACNGGVAVSGAVSATQRPPADPFLAVAFYCSVNPRYQSITIYDPLPTTAGLSALSQIT